MNTPTLEDQSRGADLAAGPGAAAGGDRGGGLEHVPAPLRRRLRRSAHGQRHVRDVAGAARCDGARRRGLRRLAQLLPARGRHARRVRLPAPDPDPPGPRRRASAGERPRRARLGRPLQPLLHDLTGSRRARRRRLARRVRAGGERPGVDVPVQGQHRPRRARARAARGRPRADRVRPPGGVPEHGRRPAVLARQPAGRPSADDRVRRPLHPRLDAASRRTPSSSRIASPGRRAATSPRPDPRILEPLRRRRLLVEEGPLRPHRRLPRPERRRARRACARGRSSSTRASPTTAAWPVTTWKPSPRGSARPPTRRWCGT